ncbi:MAG TPA: hypothetical protein VLA12_14060, partial [Planctomycetaceae bacterium]|nr:hypothetical protein [Planctomycetaceae bacterium]
MKTILTTLFASCLFVSTCTAQTSYPMIMSLAPNSAQIGQTSEHTVKSRYDLSGTLSVWISGTGVTAEPIHPELKEGETPKSTTSLKIKVTVAPDAMPGVREFRLSTVNGASTVGQLVVVRDPVVVEHDKNNSTEEAQLVALPATICGAIEKNEDLDFFK